MSAPRRLLDDPALAQELRTDLSRAAARGSDYDAAAGLAALQVAIAASSAAASASSAPAAGAAAAKTAGTLSATTLKIGIALVSTAAIAAGAATWHAARKAPISRAKPVAPAQTPAPPAEAAAPAEMTSDDARPEAPVPDIDPTLRREIDQVARIKALIDRDPAQAYALAQRGHSEFRTGMLRHEREGLAVLALWNMGRTREAEQRTRAFLARYPHSPLRDALEQRRGASGR